MAPGVGRRTGAATSGRRWAARRYDLRRGIDLLAVLCMTASTVALLRYRAVTHTAAGLSRYG